jgi:hypothetical protein
MPITEGQLFPCRTYRDTGVGGHGLQARNQNLRLVTVRGPP